MRGALLAIIGATLVLATAACGGGSGTPTYPINVYVEGKHVVSVPPGHAEHWLPSPIRISKGYGQDVVHIDLGVATRLVDRGLEHHAGRIDLPYTLVSSVVPVPPQHAIYKNGSEIAALSMILQVPGIDAGQPGLQDLLPRSAPTEPETLGSGDKRWGDPETGFVGPLDSATAFGVFQKPIQQLAKHYKVTLTDITGRDFAAFRKDVLEGHPAIVWVGGEAADTSTWVTPSGKRITANLGEQAMLVVGVGPNYVLVNDPENGLRYKLKESEFVSRWAMFGNRALELP